ncbi:hypothetical protein MAR_023629 [Mya arenaria]|uniref:Uncharacterized protein n=1 Tax=Mya arenaria TaxID=6604 RepID=A0ABY7DNH4_MYAAR|nr:hypothetical protein MAR_023629 [Mya arenaria]
MSLIHGDTSALMTLGQMRLGSCAKLLMELTSLARYPANMLAITDWCQTYNVRAVRMTCLCVPQTLEVTATADTPPLWIVTRFVLLVELIIRPVV